MAPHAPVKTKADRLQIDKSLYKKRGKRSDVVGPWLRRRRDLYHWVRWPRNVRIQRKRKVLQLRLRTPPAIHQFTYTLDSQQARGLFEFLRPYRPEEPAARKQRLTRAAELKAAKADVPPELERGPLSTTLGLNAVTSAIESKRAKLVVIAHDVDPIELVIFLPALCHRMDVPYCIVKSKARLGRFARTKTCTCIAIVDVKPGHRDMLAQLCGGYRSSYNDRYALVSREWGAPVMSSKTMHKQRIAQAAATAS